MLGELAELSLVVAKELAVRLRASEDVDETVALAGAFHKASRVVRLTLALDAKLERDAGREAQAQAREAREIQAEAEKAEAAAQAQARRAAEAAQRPSPIRAKQDRVRSLMSRLLWNESEGDSEEYDILDEDLWARLGEAARDPAFLDLPVELIAGRIAADMALSGQLTPSVCEPAAPAAHPSPPPPPPPHGPSP